MRKRGLSLIALLVLMLAVLAGCAEGTGHLTVHKDGSADVELKVRLESRLMNLLGGKGDEALRWLEQALAERDIKFSKKEDGGVEYTIARSFASVQEMRDYFSQFATGSDAVEVKVETGEHFFYTTQDVSIQLRSDSYLDQALDKVREMGVPEPLISLLLRNFAFNLQLTLPFDVVLDHNAVQEGKTLTWRVALENPDPIRLKIWLPNIAPIAWTSGIVLVIAGVLVALWIRKRRTGRSKPANLT